MGLDMVVWGLQHMELNEINLLQEPALFLLSQEKINTTEGMPDFAPISKGNQDGGIKFGTQDLALVPLFCLPWGLKVERVSLSYWTEFVYDSWFWEIIVESGTDEPLYLKPQV